MSVDIRVEIKNLKQIREALAKSPRIVSEYMNRAIRASIFEIERATIPITPVDTGRLRGSFERSFGLLRGEIYPTVDYAIYVHEGTRYMAARPYLAQGVETANQDIQRHFEQELENALEAIAREAR